MIKMLVNDLICETLYPNHALAKIYAMKNEIKRHNVLIKLENIIKTGTREDYKKFDLSLPKLIAN